MDGNTKIGVTEIVSEGADWIKAARDRASCQAVMNTV
jgi:hypothetical protein